MSRGRSVQPNRLYGGALALLALFFWHASSALSPLSHDDLETWFDGYMPYALQSGDVAGAVVVVVKDGQVVLQKGYGYADMATRRPVDPQRTLFRPGSVSKLIAWTTVMQQVEQGRLDLDRDINNYLDFTIPPFRDRPITLRNLMTHTPGFEYSIKDVVSDNPTGPPSLAEYLRREVPARIFPAGEVPSYSNYGVALAGYIVQRVSGQSFDDYVEQHVFAPLNMHDATFRQPLPTQFQARMSSGYKLASEPPRPYEMLAVAPAGSSAITGADMAKFMIAHLQNGEYNGQRILLPDTARMMHDTVMTVVSPHLNRMLLGFYEFTRNEHRIIGHDGDTLWFHSVLQLFPDDHVGLFVSLNSAGRDGAARAIRRGLVEGFADRYFSGPGLATVSAETARADAALLVGSYDSSQSEQTTFLSVANLVSQVHVTADEAGHILTSATLGPSGEPKKFAEVARFVWREVGGQERLAAKVVDGRVVMWASDAESPSLVYLRTPAWRNAVWLAPLLILSLVALLLTAFLWPIGAIVRRRYGVVSHLQGRRARSYRWARVGAVASGILMLAWLTTVAVMASTFSFSSSQDPWILSLHLLSILVFPLAAAAALWNFRVTCAIRGGSGTVFARIWSGVLAVSCLSLLWVALVFHLIGLGLTF